MSTYRHYLAFTRNVNLLQRIQSKYLKDIYFSILNQVKILIMFDTILKLPNNN